MGEGLTNPHHEKPACHKVLYRTSQLYGFFGMT